MVCLSLTRNRVAFWLLGLCNNFAYVIMLSAAKDIIDKNDSLSISVEDSCEEVIKKRHCSLMSTGSVLLANIIPAFFVKISAPFILNRIAFSIRHFLIVILQAISFIIVAQSKHFSIALAGVALASFGSGMGEVTYLSLTSHFDSSVVSTWSSGTGGAGLIGSFIYAALTDRYMLNMSPHNALLLMLIVPPIFAFVYHFGLVFPSTVHRIDSAWHFSSYLIPNSRLRRRGERDNRYDEEEEDQLLDDKDDHSFYVPRTLKEKLTLAKPLLPLMICLSLVYFAEYFINQGLVEFLQFNCNSGFRLSWAMQYRWYQVLYQIGVFISRSSIECFTLPASLLFVLPLLQIGNVIILFWDAILQFIPHILIVFSIIFFEGLIGGAAYVNVFHTIYKTTEVDKREFSMGFAAISDSFGILCAGLFSIPVHNFICNLM